MDVKEERVIVKEDKPVIDDDEPVVNDMVGYIYSISLLSPSSLTPSSPFNLRTTKRERELMMTRVLSSRSRFQLILRYKLRLLLSLLVN
jgi:hypothetical protein